MSSASLLPLVGVQPASRSSVSSFEYSLLHLSLCWLTTSAPYPPPSITRFLSSLPSIMSRPKDTEFGPVGPPSLLCFLVDGTSLPCDSLQENNVWNLRPNLIDGSRNLQKPPVASWVRAEPDHRCRLVTESETLLLTVARFPSLFSSTLASQSTFCAHFSFIHFCETLHPHFPPACPPRYHHDSVIKLLEELAEVPRYRREVQEFSPYSVKKQEAAEFIKPSCLVLTCNETDFFF